MENTGQIRTEKALLRQRFKLLRNSFPDKPAASSKILLAVCALREYMKAGSILIYASTKEEVATDELISRSLASGKKVYIPFVLTPAVAEIHDCADLVAGPLGIRQPKPGLLPQTRKIPGFDLIIVPGLAFDLEHHRLGSGSGWYDRFLGSLSQKTSTIGLAFEVQITPELPREDSDVPVEMVVTEQRLF